MSNLETAPGEVVRAASGDADGQRIEVLHPQEVPLGGPQAMRVRRTLPQRQRSLIGAWCFLDHYGPTSERMDVPPHPHTGLQTVSWLFSGEVEHRDSAGVHAMVRPGEVNLMTAGAGICHSEVSTGPGVLRGVQLWAALPDAHRDARRDFAHYVPTPVAMPGATARVFLGELANSRSPVHTFTPLLGAQLTIDADAVVDVAVDPAFEHGVLCDVGELRMGPATLVPGDLGYQGPGSAVLRLHNVTDRRARMLLLGGTPFGEELVMWWNFVGRNHDDIAGYRRQWQEGDERFGAVRGYQGRVTRLAAPPLPTTRLVPRSAPSGHPVRSPQTTGEHMTTDKTGAPTTVTAEPGRYTITVEGKHVGHADFADRGNQRVFHHTEIDPAFGGRGLATILLEEALAAARADGRRIVPVCSMVGTVLKKHPEFDDITDPVTADAESWADNGA